MNTSVTGANNNQQSNTSDAQAVLAKLSAPFDVDVIRVKPGPLSRSGKAKVHLYVDARAVIDRLNAVLGFNWQFAWESVPLPDGKIGVRGRLTIRLSDTLVCTREDAGEASDEMEALKSAVSDALKRTSVQFGVGRFLYDMPDMWWSYDAQTKRFSEPDQLMAAVTKVLKSRLNGSHGE